ncbi:hypothetical protein HMPREF3202_01311 [Prevotella bivia]|uniref:Uncharacterized protein n=1 Tax=Prevotella bivia TaxID=28125 RepID=A0A137SWZ0_9BACT|nr:hypothetical protein HMPREF3202_01311 [Prevotella bivia]
MLAITQQTPYTHVVSKETEQQGILAIPFEVFKAFPKVGTEQRVRLPLCHIRCETLSPLQLMPIPNIWIILPDMHTLKVFFSLSLNNLSQRLPYAQKVGGLLVTPCFV